MGTSTVSGPFRSANGFQELVNGQWVPVAGGGGNSNDIVVSGEIYAGQPGNIYGVSNCACFYVDTNFTMGEIQSSLSSNGKWSCFSGYTIQFYQSAVSNPNSSYQGFQYSCLASYQVANCVCEVTGAYGGFYSLVNNEMGAICPYANNANSGCYSVALNTYIDWVDYTPSFCSSGIITTGVACGTPANSLSCPALIVFNNQNAFNCGNNGPAIKYTLRLKFDRLINWP